MPQEFSLPHHITYHTEQHVEVAVVARSLLASEILIRESLDLLGGLVPGSAISVSGMRVGHLSNNSPLKEVLWVGVVVAFQDDLTEIVPKMIESLLLMPIPEDYESIVTVLVLVLAISIIDQCVQRLFPGKEIKNLKKEYEDKLDRLSEMTGKSAKDIDLYMKQRISSKLKNRLAMAALDFFLPAKQDGGVAISGVLGQMVSADAVREVPSEIDFQLLEKRNTYELSGVVVDIHRADIDSNTNGWRGAVEQVTDKILRMELAPHISPRELYGKTEILADIVVVEEKTPEGDLVAKALHVMQVHDL